MGDFPFGIPSVETKKSEIGMENVDSQHFLSQFSRTFLVKQMFSLGDSLIVGPLKVTFLFHWSTVHF